MRTAQSEQTNSTIRHTFMIFSKENMKIMTAITEKSGIYFFMIEKEKKSAETRYVI